MGFLGSFEAEEVSVREIRLYTFFHLPIVEMEEDKPNCAVDPAVLVAIDEADEDADGVHTQAVGAPADLLADGCDDVSQNFARLEAG